MSRTACHRLQLATNRTQLTMTCVPCGETLALESTMTLYQPVNEQLGYCFHPPTAEHRLGYPQLDVVIRPTPTGEHFDPESVTCLTATANGSGKLRVVHPWAQDSTYRVCAGEIDIEDERHEHVKAFTFGGDLRIDSDARRTVCQIISPVPLLEHARQALSLEEHLIEEVYILFAERRAARDDDVFDRKLAAADACPRSAFLSPLFAPIIRCDEFGAFQCGMAVEVEQIRPAPMAGERHPSLGLQRDPIGRVRNVFRTPDIIQVVRAADGAQVGDDGPPGAKFVICQINRVCRTLKPVQLGNADLFPANHIKRAGKAPGVNHVADQLTLFGIAWAGVNPDFAGIVRCSTAEVRSEHLPPDRIVAPWDVTVVIIRIHQQGNAHLMQIAQTVCPFSRLLRPCQRRQQHRRQDSNDGDDYQQFDQGECQNLDGERIA